MIYLFTEDMKSGPQFWETLLSTQSTHFSIITHEGCLDLLSDLEHIFRKPILTSGSICIVAIDMANTYILKDLKAVLLEIQEYLPCFFTNYLCIEASVLMSLAHLELLDPHRTPVDCSAAFNRFTQCYATENFNEFWNARIQYDEIMQPFYQSLLYTKSTPSHDLAKSVKHQCQGYTTLEQAIAGLLSRTTQGTGFKFTKSDIGKCWTKDCCWGVNEVGEQFAKPCTLTELLTQKEKADKIIDSSGFNNCISDISGNRMGLRDMINLAAQLEAEAKDQGESNFGITHEFV